MKRDILPLPAPREVVMKLAFCFAILAAVVPRANPDPARALRAALGGDAALAAIQRLHIKASFDGYRGKGETESFIVLPERLLEKTQIGQLRHPAGVPDAVSTAPFEHAERDYTSRTDGFAESMPLPSGVPAPKWWTRELREQSLVASRFTYTRLLIPLVGTASTVTSAVAIPGGIVFQDRDRTTWTLKLDASGLPASMTIDGQSPRVITFSDYRRVGGAVSWPHKFVMTANGDTETTWIRSYEINGKIPKVLEK